MQEELDAQADARNFAICKQNDILLGAKPFPGSGIWQMKHKCCILTQEVYKWKVQLCLDGSCQVFGRATPKHMLQ